MLRVADHAERTDTGRLRRVNEDSHHARSPLFVIADGMGGAQAGEVASSEVIGVFRNGLSEGSGSVEERLAAMVVEANRRVHELAGSDRDLEGMGTTTTAAYVSELEIAFAHVGDSRAYLLRDGSLERLTDDHTLVEELLRQGRITPEEAEHHPQRSVVTRSVGPFDVVEVDHFSVRGRQGDVFLLCSDGLTSMVSEARVAEVLREAPSLDRAAADLVQAANDAGGRDNITVILFALEELAGATSDDRTMAGAGGPSTAEVRAAVAAAEQPTPVREPAPDTVVPRAPRPPREEQPSRRRRRGWGALVVAMIILMPIAGGAYLASQAVYFLGVASDGSVTVYQGLPYELPLGLDLYSPAYVTGLTPAQLPAARRDQLLDHKLRSHDDAFDLARQLELGRLEDGPEGRQ